MPRTIENDENQRAEAAQAPPLAAKDASKPTPLTTDVLYNNQASSSGSSSNPSSASLSTPNYLLSSPESAPGLSGSSRTSSVPQSSPETPLHFWGQGDAPFSIDKTASTEFRPEECESLTSPTTISHKAAVVEAPASPLIRDFALDRVGSPRSGSPITIRRATSIRSSTSPGALPATRAENDRTSPLSLQETPPEFYTAAHWEAFRASRGEPDEADDTSGEEFSPCIPPNLHEPYVEPDSVSSVKEEESSPTRSETIARERQGELDFALWLERPASLEEDTSDQRTITGPSHSYRYERVPCEDPDVISPCESEDILGSYLDEEPDNVVTRPPISEDWNALAALSMADMAEAGEEALDHYNRFRDVAESYGIENNTAYDAVERYFSIQPMETRERVIGSLLREYEDSPWLSVGENWQKSATPRDTFDFRTQTWFLDAYNELRMWMSSEVHQERLCKYLRERLVLSTTYTNDLLDCFRPCIDKDPPTRLEKIKTALNAVTDSPERAKEKKRARKTLSGSSSPSSASGTLRRISESFNQKVTSPVSKTVQTTTRKISEAARKVSGSFETFFEGFAGPVDDPSKVCHFCDQRGHEIPSCPTKRRRENILHYQAQEDAMKEIEAQPGFWKKKNYGAARLDRGPLSKIKLGKSEERTSRDTSDSQGSSAAGPTPPRHGSFHFESLEEYKEMCTTGCDEYGYGKDHTDHPKRPAEGHGRPSKADKGKGRATDETKTTPNQTDSHALSSDAAPESFASIKTCIYCSKVGHRLDGCDSFKARYGKALQTEICHSEQEKDEEMLLGGKKGKRRSL